MRNTHVYDIASSVSLVVIEKCDNEPRPSETPEMFGYFPCQYGLSLQSPVTAHSRLPLSSSGFFDTWLAFSVTHCPGSGVASRPLSQFLFTSCYQYFSLRRARSLNPLYLFS